MKNMKKLLGILVIALSLFTASPVLAQEKIDLYFFYGDGCPHCAKEEVFLEQLKKENSNIEIHSFETWNNRDNAEFLVKLGKELGIKISGVPLLLIGDRTVSGFYSAETTGKKITDIIDNYDLYGCKDIVAPLLAEKGDNNLHDNCEGHSEKVKNDIPESVALPFFGEVKTKNISLPLLTFFIAATDGFNPCAMWVLLFLINLLFGMKDRKKMWILGSAFIVSSGLVYFLFLSAWLNLFMFLEYVLWIRVLIAVIALASGVYHVKDWWDNRDGGCHVINSEKRKRVFVRIKEIINAQSFLVSLFGIIVLAGAVNLVELVCSAGLPAIYTQVLAMSNLPVWQYYGYLLFYILIFMIDDIFVFVIAMKTLEIKVGDTWFARYSSLIGGIIMVILGVLLAFKPGWLMFG